MVSCQIAAPIYVDATVYVHIAEVNNLYYYISEYLQNLTFAPSRIITQDTACVNGASDIVNAVCELLSPSSRISVIAVVLLCYVCVTYGFLLVFYSSFVPKTHPFFRYSTGNYSVTSKPGLRLLMVSGTNTTPMTSY